MAQATRACSAHSPGVQEAAAEVVRLIHSRPHSPRPDEIAAIIARAIEGPEPVVQDDDGPITFESLKAFPFERVLGSDGNPVQFDLTHEQFAQEFCPWLGWALEVLACDREGVTEIVRGFASDPEDPDAEELFRLLCALESIGGRLAAYGESAKSAWCRLIAVAEASCEEEDSDVAAVLGRGAGRYLAKHRDADGEADARR